jgi:hypothetical protein
VVGSLPDIFDSLPSLKNIYLDDNELQGPFLAFETTVTTIDARFIGYSQRS